MTLQTRTKGISEAAELQILAFLRRPLERRCSVVCLAQQLGISTNSLRNRLRRRKNVGLARRKVIERERQLFAEERFATRVAKKVCRSVRTTQRHVEELTKRKKANKRKNVLQNRYADLSEMKMFSTTGEQSSQIVRARNLYT